MPTTKTIILYQFEELSEAAKEKARDWYRTGNLDYEWWDFVYEDAKNMGSLMGIEISNIWFSGFSSQGDGACFEGSYEYVKGGLKAIMAEAPQDTELHDFARRLQALQRPYFYLLTAHVKHSGHYQHSGCTDIDVETSDDYRRVDDDTFEDVKQVLREFMDWIYKRLENEYDHLQSDESVDESIKANEYTFLENGEREG